MSFVKRRKQAHLYRSKLSNGEENQRQGHAQERVQVSPRREDRKGQGQAQETALGPLLFDCPYCGAKPPERCVSTSGKFLDGYHTARKEKAA